jgi:predicted DNA binding CopG/RHH family protein
MTIKTKNNETDLLNEWDYGTLGQSADFAEVSNAIDEESLNESLCLQSINIRMPKDLLDDLKRIATLNGIGYQPLMKQVLQRFVTCEMKQLLRDAADREAARKKMDSQIEQTKPTTRTQKRA